MASGTGDSKGGLTLDEAYELIRRRTQPAMTVKQPKVSRSEPPASIAERQPFVEPQVRRGPSVEISPGGLIGLMDAFGLVGETNVDVPPRTLPSDPAVSGDHSGEIPDVPPRFVHAGIGTMEPAASMWKAAKDLYQAYELGVQTRDEAAQAARQMAPGDQSRQIGLLAEGQLDAWRHAEWNRRMANELGPTTAFLVANGYELGDLAYNIARDAWAPPMYRPNTPLRQRFQSALQDVTNNRFGRGAGPQPISKNDPRLVFLQQGKVSAPAPDAWKYVKGFHP